ncbi:hypothetical protein WN943_011912 [Citrus x changshan-huyou]
MAWSATMIGALLGLGTQMYSNALRKLPYMRHPWEHLLGMGLGAVFVNQLVKWDAQLQQDLDKMLEKAKAANERRYFGWQVAQLENQNALWSDLPACMKMMSSGGLRGIVASPKKVSFSKICCLQFDNYDWLDKLVFCSVCKEVIFKFAGHKFCAVFVGTG